MTARPEIRAKRRAVDLGIADDETKVAELALQIAERDRRDRERNNSPLTLSADMIELDNSDMSFDEQVNFIISLASERFDIKAYAIANTG